MLSDVPVALGLEVRPILVPSIYILTVCVTAQKPITSRVIIKRRRSLL